MKFEALGNEPFHDAGEIIVASDPNATRRKAFVRRNSAGNVECLTRRDGTSGHCYSLREFKDDGPQFRYLGEGDTYAELAENISNRHRPRFSETMDGSIADVVAKHALAAMREIELRQATK